MSWTLTEAKDMLAKWLEAESSITAGGQSYKVGTRALTRADLSEISKRIQFWRNEVERLTAGRKAGARVMRVVPRDL